MIYEFEPLNNEEKELMLKAPALIAVLIAGADDKIDQRELNRAIELVNIKTFSEKQDLQLYYQEVHKTIEKDIDAVIAALPGTADTRNPVISEELGKLNAALASIKPKFAHDLYVSWKGYSKKVAQAWGGVMGYKSISRHEEMWVNLPMINEPAQAL